MALEKHQIGSQETSTKVVKVHYTQALSQSSQKGTVSVGAVVNNPSGTAKSVNDNPVQDNGVKNSLEQKAPESECQIVDECEI